MRTLHISLAFLVGAALGGCSSYKPSLGQAPFLCGDTDPKCPDGFSCQDDGNGNLVCLAPGATAPDARPDTPGFQCADDSLVEGAGKNDTKDTAFYTNITPTHLVGAYSDLSICPAGDRDTYAIVVAADTGGANPNIEAITSWGSGKTVSVTILESHGTAVANSMAVEGMMEQRAYLANASPGTYYLQAFGAATTENNYGLKINITY